MFIRGRDNELNEWIRSQGGGFAPPGAFAAMGWETAGRIRGAITWSAYNGKHCLCTIAVADGSLPLPLIREGLLYSFSQLALRRLTFIVSSANIRSQSLVRRLGATLEATLRDADPSGDALIFALFPEDCKLWSRFDERQRKPAPST